MAVENQKGALAAAQAEPLENPSEFFSHGEGDSPRTHASEKTRGSVLGFAVLLTLTFSAVELIGGWLANSLALIGDAGHMLTDSMSLFFARIANRIAMKGADKVHSFGHGRVEVIAAFVNGLIMLGVVLWLFLEAFERIRDELKLNPNHRPHDGRTHFVTMAKRYGVDEYAIKYMVGHKISDITEKVYTRREFAWLREEIEKIK